MMPDNAIHEALDALNDVRWRETAFADLQWYYAEGGVYVLRCKKGEPNAHLCVIRAKSADEAIARAVFDLHKVGKAAGDKAAIREALERFIGWYDVTSIRTPCLRKVAETARAALDKPPRNCEVGTPDEQSARFDAHCRKHMGCLTCPLREKDGSVPKHCEFAWGAMPFTEGGEQ